MLHSCSVEGCSTMVFGRGPCVEHGNPRVPLAEQLLAGAVAAAQKDQVDAKAATVPAAGSIAPD
jgi:hypothetical protein